MMIKEYRIPLPFTVEEYRIAQLYMVARTSRAETGHGEGVQVLKNEPYTDANGQSGQYTHKIIHIGKRLPTWIKTFIPASALQIEEKSWNAYPYVKAVYTCPFLGGVFSIEVETTYLNDDGKSQNVLGVDAATLADMPVDVIDIAKDKVYDGEVLPAEKDPKKFQSQKTGRGPLAPDWTKSHKPIMTVYKLCKVAFEVWGVQTRAETFIHKTALRDVLLRGHRDAFVWLDEWHGLTIEDIRAYEKDTALHLDQALHSPPTPTSAAGTPKSNGSAPAST